MPYFTPECSDEVVVYTMVDEACSGLADSVGIHIKKRTCALIGVDEYPKYMITGGDQRTYSIV